MRSLRKTAKAYLWDWSLVPDPGSRFENLVGSPLLELCHYLQDVEGCGAELHYLRDRSGREVDFLVTLGRKPWFAVEVKTSETKVDSALIYFRDRLKITWSYQVVLESHRDFVQDGIRCKTGAVVPVGGIEHTIGLPPRDGASTIGREALVMERAAGGAARP